MKADILKTILRPIKENVNKSISIGEHELYWQHMKMQLPTDLYEFSN